MTPGDALLLVLLGTGAGALIGCVGIGGVVIVPALVHGFGLPVPTSIAAALLAFLVSGVAGTAAYGRSGSIRWRPALWVCAGALPLALLGALAVHASPAALIEAVIALLAAASGVHALQRRTDPPHAAPLPSRPRLVAAGAVTGFLSALTGTGGPLVLIPLLVVMQVPTLTAIGLGQAVQLPIAGIASLGNALVGVMPLRLGLFLGAGLAVGTWLGARAAHALPLGLLRRLVAVLLVVVGAALLARLLAMSLG